LGSSPDSKKAFAATLVFHPLAERKRAAWSSLKLQVLG